MTDGRRLRIVIAGGGPVGLACAALLSSEPEFGRVELSVLDSGRPRPWAEDSVDLRVYALSRASQALFARLGLWDTIADLRVSPYRSMRVWQGDDPRGPASVFFEAATIAEPDLGHIVEDGLLRHVLLDHLRTLPNVRIAFQTAVTGIERAAGRLRIRTDGDETLRADLLIGADGAESRVRGLAGIATVQRHYGQRGLVVHVASAEPHGETAWQRFGSRGPLALLPLADGRSSVVWSVRNAEADRLLGLDDATFARELERASSHVLGELEVTSPRAAFPLRLRHAARYTNQSIAIIGDAAHAVHPLAGQGMNLGLLDAAELVGVIARASVAGEYCADRYVLDRYARARRAHNLRMQLAFDGIDRLFRLGGLAVPLRAAGMLAVDAAAPLKRILIEHAMGLDSGWAREAAGRDRERDSDPLTTPEVGV